MNTLLSLVLCGMVLLTGCESEEAKQERILEATKVTVETGMANNDAYAQLSDKEWSIDKVGDGYIVTLNAEYTYLVIMGVTFRYTVSNDMYVTGIDMYIGDTHQHEDIPKNENSKLDI